VTPLDPPVSRLYDSTLNIIKQKNTNYKNNIIAKQKTVAVVGD